MENTGAGNLSLLNVSLQGGEKAAVSLNQIKRSNIGFMVYCLPLGEIQMAHSFIELSLCDVHSRD